MTKFFETIMGRRFFEGQLPKLITNLDRIATALEKANELKEKEIESEDRKEF